MSRGTPQVQDGVVYPRPAGDHGAVAIAVGTPAWYAWLERTPTFAFAHAGGTFTARKERRRGGQYWYAYRRRQGKLHTTYGAIAALSAGQPSPRTDARRGWD